MLKLDMKDKKQVYVFRTLPFIADSRVKRYLSIFSKSYEVTFKTWEKEKISINGVEQYPLFKSGRFLTKVAKFIGFEFFCLISFLKLKKGDVAVLMDLDTALVPVLFKFLNPNVIIIFDIVDPFSQTKALKFGWLHNAINFIEFHIAKRADLCIVPHECRLLFYEESLSSVNSAKLNPIIIENIPDNFSSFTPTFPVNERLTIGYFGTLDALTRGLEELLNYAKVNPDVSIVIAGSGALSDTFEKASNMFPNIKFLGKYNYHELPKLYDKVDFTWAFYSPEIRLHKYACPNKFFEHIVFCTPIIISEVTPQSASVKESNTGIVVNKIDDIFENDFKNKLVYFYEQQISIQTKLLGTREFYMKYYNLKQEELAITLHSLK